jgi:hypothetical protein
MAYFVDGIIVDGQQVCITATRNTKDGQKIASDVFLLTRNTDGSYGWTLMVDKNGDTDIPTNYSAFIIDIDETETSQNPSKFNLKDGLSFKWLNIQPSSKIPTSSIEKPDPFMGKQSLYQPWRKPFAFFPGIVYTITDSDNKLISETITFVPIVWYKYGVCGIPVSPVEALTYHFQWVFGSKILPQAWMDQKDCQQQVDYNMCSPGNYCKTDCKAPCQDLGKECEWIGNQFVCMRDATSGWWFSRTTIIVVCVAIVAIIFGIVISFFRHPKITDPYGGKIKKGDKVLTVSEYEEALRKSKNSS